MIEELLRESDRYLVEAAAAMLKYKKIDDYQSIFEAGNPDIVMQEEVNEEVASKSQGFLSKAWAAIKKAIKTLMSKIKDFVDRLFMSAEEKIGLKQFEEMMKQNPEFANKRITVKDYRAIIAQAEKHEKELEQAIREIEAGKETNLQKVFSGAADWLKGNFNGVTTAVTCDVARKRAMADAEFARKIYSALQYDLISVEKLEKELGKKQADKFVKDISKYTKESKARQFLLSVRKKKFDTIQDCIRSTTKELGTTAAGLNFLGKSLKANPYTNETLKQAKSGALDSIFHGRNIRKGLEKGRLKIDQAAEIEANTEFYNKMHYKNGKRKKMK